MAKLFIATFLALFGMAQALPVVKEAVPAAGDWAMNNRSVKEAVPAAGDWAVNNRRAIEAVEATGKWAVNNRRESLGWAVTNNKRIEAGEDGVGVWARRSTVDKSAETPDEPGWA